VKDNTVNGKPLVYLEDVANYNVTDAGQVILVRCDSIWVENLNLSRTEIGVQLLGTSNSVISGNKITENNRYGIWFSESSNNSVSGNNITNNNWHGIRLDFSDNNSIRENKIAENNYCGIWLISSSNNSIDENNITENGDYGIYLSDFSYNNSISGNTFVKDGLHVLDSYWNVVVDNLVNGKPLVYLEDFSNYTVDGAGQVVLVNCNNIHVENLNLSHTDIGIDLWGTNNTKISANNITNNNWNGIWLAYSNNNSISRNHIANNYDGIYSYFSSNNSISANNIANNDYGIEFAYSNNNSISGNYIKNNGQGISITCHSNNNSVSGNNITENKDYGVWHTYSSGNKIYHNNLINNTSQVSGDQSTNFWDNGYPSGGNYWSDYAGADLCSGSYQNETGSDGIGDTRYNVDAKNKDRYPLTAPFSTFNAGVWNGETYCIDIVSNSTISNFQFNETQKTISFNVSGLEDAAGSCRITIPNIIIGELWQGNYTVLLNNEPWPFRNWTDTSNTYIYLNYTLSEHQIIIVPEFPSSIILSLLMVFSIIVIVFTKKKPIRTTKLFK
jgi:parallel beta-helix repeat protein